MGEALHPPSTATGSPNTTKGDVAGYDSASARIPIGADATVLTADSTQTLGVKWAAAGASALTTKGDVLGYDSSTNRVPIGTNGQSFVADSSQALGLKWGVALLAGGGTGLSSYTAGDTVYYAAGTLLSKLTIGSANYVMTSSGTAPQWSATVPLISGGTGTAAASANAAFNALSPLSTKGDVLGFSTVNARLAVGTDGQILTADAASTLGFKWAAAAGGSSAFTTAVTVTLTDAATNTCTDFETDIHNSSGTTAANFGTRWLTQAQNASAGAAVDQTGIRSYWTVATAAAEASAVSFGLRAAGAALPAVGSDPHIWLAGSYTTTGFVRTGAGTASAPALAIGEANSGWFRQGANNLCLTINGTTFIDVSSNFVDLHGGRIGSNAGNGTAVLSFCDRNATSTGLNFPSAGRWDLLAVAGVLMSGTNAAATPKISFFNATPVIQQTIGAITNSVTSGGSTGVIANYTDLAVYANDAAAIRNDIYQLALFANQTATALRNFGLAA